MWGAIAERRKMIQVFCFFTLLVLQLWCFSWQVPQVWASSNAENQGWWQSLTFTESISTSYSHLPKLHRGGSLILIFHSRKLAFKLWEISPRLSDYWVVDRGVKPKPTSPQSPGCKRPHFAAENVWTEEGLPGLVLPPDSAWRPSHQANKASRTGLSLLPSDAEAETPILGPLDVRNWLNGKDPDTGKEWRWEEKGTTEDEMVGWHHRLNGLEFE